MSDGYHVIDGPDPLQVSSSLLLYRFNRNDGRVTFIENTNTAPTVFWVWIDEVRCLDGRQYEYELKGKGKKFKEGRLKRVTITYNFNSRQGWLEFSK